VNVPASQHATHDLLERARQQSQRAFSLLLERIGLKLRVWLRFHMTDAVRAVTSEDDLLQETWVVAAQKLGEFEYRGPGSLHQWMAKILRHHLLHAQREVARGERARTAQASAGDPDLLRALLDSTPGISTQAGSKETASRIAAVLRSLPDEERQVLLLRVYEGLSGREIAAQLAVEPSTVSMRFHRALGKCAQRLRDLDA
jgi:RNA polymerase sigma-70 factor (ECF subfamily)